MPLYTYVVTYRGGGYVAQASHSNFKGFVSEWADDVPMDALPGLTPALKRELSVAAYRGDFMLIPNRHHVWKKVLTLGGCQRSQRSLLSGLCRTNGAVGDTPVAPNRPFERAGMRPPRQTSGASAGRSAPLR